MSLNMTIMPVSVWKQCHPTFVVEEPLHLHGGPGVSDAEHGTGHDALLGRRAVCGPHQDPVRLVVETLQNLHSLASPHRQLPAATSTAGQKVMDHHRQLTATGKLKWKKIFIWKPINDYLLTDAGIWSFYRSRLQKAWMQLVFNLIIESRY